jgi:hypothetical protein
MLVYNLHGNHSPWTLKAKHPKFISITRNAYSQYCRFLLELRYGLFTPEVTQRECETKEMEDGVTINGAEM